MGGCIGESCVGGSCDSVTLVLATSGLEELLRAKWERRGIGGGKMGRGGECGGGDRKGEREADKTRGDKEGGRKGEEEGEKKMGSGRRRTFKPSLQMAHVF